MENYEKAIEELEEWLMVNPNEEQAIELLKYLRSQAQPVKYLNDRTSIMTISFIK